MRKQPPPGTGMLKTARTVGVGSGTVQRIKRQSWLPALPRRRVHVARGCMPTVALLHLIPARRKSGSVSHLSTSRQPQISRE
jgi:hypothetical protein